MPTLDLSAEILETLSEAAVEIANLDGPENIVCRRLRTLQRKLSPQSVTIGEIARRIDVAPHDVLAAAIESGAGPFWHEGQQFRDAAKLRTYLRLQMLFDPVREIEFNLWPDEATRLAEELGITVAELLDEDPSADDKSALGPRRFVASEQRLPQDVAAGLRSRQSG